MDFHQEGIQEALPDSMAGDQEVQLADDQEVQFQGNVNQSGREARQETALPPDSIEESADHRA